MHPLTGELTVREPEEGWMARRAAPFSGPKAPQFVFRLASMEWPLFESHGRAVTWGEGVWLVAADGRGTHGWRSGAVVAPAVFSGDALPPLSAAAALRIAAGSDARM